jgi:polyferredoxin
VKLFVWIRRGWQAVFLGLFLFLVAVTTASLVRGYPVEWFLGLDPLVAATSALSAHTLARALLWAVPLVVLTLVFGRFFCGWICPMGVLHHAISWAARARRTTARVAGNRYLRAYRVKYWILLAVLGMAIAGSNQAGLLDPIAFTWRALATSIVPALDGAVGGPYQGLRHFHWSTLVAALFLAALAANLFLPRLYCRVLCPLGALLGLLAQRSLFRLTGDRRACTDCDLCAADCQGAAEPQARLRVSECMLCLNCAASCPSGAFSYRFLPSPDAHEESIDLGRRKAAGAVVAGLAAVPLARASDGVDPRPDPRRIRPPGALPEHRFLERCVKCGACMKVCPTGGLQPALSQAGLEGLWSPILVPRLGYCEQSCTLCGQVCPTGAIRLLSLPEKLGQPPREEPVRVGSAFVDRGRCLPWAMDTPCIVCEEVCPTSPKAVYFKVETVVARDGKERRLERPYVDLERCWGCGICETRCPVFDRAAIRVTSVGESRSPQNRIMLKGGRL